MHASHQKSGSPPKVRVGPSRLLSRASFRLRRCRIRHCRSHGILSIRRAYAGKRRSTPWRRLESIRNSDGPASAVIPRQPRRARRSKDRAVRSTAIQPNALYIASTRRILRKDLPRHRRSGGPDGPAGRRQQARRPLSIVQRRFHPGRGQERLRRARGQKIVRRSARSVGAGARARSGRGAARDACRAPADRVEGASP